MTLRALLYPLSCLATALVTVGCATKPSVPKIDASTRFEDLKTILMARVQTTQSRTPPNGWVALAAEDRVSRASIDWAEEDFKNWCTARSGVLRKPPLDRDEGGMHEARLTAYRIGYLISEGWFVEHACLVGDAVYLFERGRGGASDYRPGQFNGARFAWLSPAELDRVRPAVNAAAAEEQAKREELAAKGKRERVEAERLRKEEELMARTRAIALLKDAKAGSNLACNGEQWEGDTLAQVYYICQGSKVSFKDLSDNGWRIVQQTVTPTVDRRGRINQISLMLVKGKT